MLFVFARTLVEGINPLYSKNISVNDTSNEFGTHHLDTLGFQKLTGSKWSNQDGGRGGHFQNGRQFEWINKNNFEKFLITLCNIWFLYESNILSSNLMSILLLSFILSHILSIFQDGHHSSTKILDF